MRKLKDTPLYSNHFGELTEMIDVLRDKNAILSSFKIDLEVASYTRGYRSTMDSRSVLGYGLLVPVGQFIHKFPGTFQQPIPDAGYLPVPKKIKELNDSSSFIKFYYPRDSSVSEVFITTNYAYIAHEKTPVREVDFQKLLTGGQEFYNLLQQMFPGLTPKVIMTTDAIKDDEDDELSDSEGIDEAASWEASDDDD